MNETGKHFLTVILTSAPLWGSIGVLGGALAGYYQGTSRDTTSIVVAMIQSASTIDEKKQMFDLLVSRGLLVGVTAPQVGDVFEKNARINPATVPQGLTCDGVSCILAGQVTTIKQVYTALGIYSGPPGEAVDPAFIDATRKYQTEKGTMPDGVVGLRTFQYIQQDAQRLSIPVNWQPPA